MQTIRASVQTSIDPIKGSRFTATAAPVAGEDEARELLGAVGAEMPGASHHCWAWRLASPRIERAGDDGEPSGSAGRPILAQLTGRDLVNVGVIVSRWFGGTKLGVGGLVRAYGAAAGAALDAATTVAWVPKVVVALRYDYGDVDTVQRVLQQHGVVDVELAYTTSVRHRVEAPGSMIEAIAAALADATSGRVQVDAQADDAESGPGRSNYSPAVTNHDSETSVEVPVPDDWHVHLRDDEMLEAVVGFTARRFRHALIMPNLQPPIDTVEAASAYRERIVAAARIDGAPADRFDPWMSLYLTPTLTAEELRRGASEGVVRAVKFYPAGATTNSESGGTSLLDFAPVLEAMAELGMPLLVHAESTDPAIDIFDREAAFLEAEVAPLLDKLPELSVTIEHISTAAGIDLAREHAQAFGSITPHHLACERSDILANGLRPELYCKPVINSAANRDALIEAATSGDPTFFLGTDSAPHPLSQKEARVAKAGIFNAPFALEVTAEVFHQADALGALAAFVSTNGARRYGIAPASDRLRLTRREAAPGGEAVGTIRTTAGDEVRLFGLAEAALWTITPS